MTRHTAELLTQLQLGDGVLVTVAHVQGSAPREAGAWMAVFAQTVVNTIGGGHLEFQAIREARAWLERLASMDTPGTLGEVPDSRADAPFDVPLSRAPAAQTVDSTVSSLTTRYALGPSLGQCCGGVVHLKFEPIRAADAPALQRRLLANTLPVALFGGGHVGQALIQVLAALPYDVRWIDSRDEIFPAQRPAHVICEHSDPVQAAVADLPRHSSVLIMSFSHAEDLEVVAACLKRQRQQGDLKLIGLIGSKTKWATFAHRLQARGFSAQELSWVTCPIGVSGIKGKEPEVIAVSVAAQLLQHTSE